MLLHNRDTCYLRHNFSGKYILWGGFSASGKALLLEGCGDQLNIISRNENLFAGLFNHLKSLLQYEPGLISDIELLESQIAGEIDPEGEFNLIYRSALD